MARLPLMLKLIKRGKLKISKFQMKIRTSNHQYQEIQEFLEPYFEKATEGRKYISADVEDEAFIYDESEEE